MASAEREPSDDGVFREDAPTMTRHPATVWRHLAGGQPLTLVRMFKRDAPEDAVESEIVNYLQTTRNEKWQSDKRQS